jgi:uncharacterized protein YceH (UPF0502 family)
MSVPEQLTPVEARVLSVMIEKAATVPDTYPLSLNSLLTGCNQKTARDPVMEVSESEALEALDNLRGHDLIIESSGSRVTKYSHNMGRVYQLPTPSVALLATLMLRGPQTVAELRANTERLYRFADASSLEAFLEELSTRNAGALTVLLPRAPGARESRWAHLLCGTPEIPVASGQNARAPDNSLAAEVAALREEVTALRAEVEALKAQR